MSESAAHTTPDARTIRVMLVAAASSTTGGGEKHVADLIRRLPDLGVEPTLVCPPGGDLCDLAASLGVATVNVPIASGFSWGRVRAVRDAIERGRPDVVHAHGSRAAMFARLADPRAAERVVYTVHGIHADKAGSALRQRVVLGIERYLRPRTVAFVTVCESDAAKGARLGVLDAERTVTIHNGIELPVREVMPGTFRSELGLGREDPLVLHVGRFDVPKDQATLLRAWANVAPAVPRAVLVIVGGGPLEDELRELATSYGIAKRVRFVAPRPDLAPVYTDADVFVLSSRWEGFPYVVLEAMAYQLPVVATAVDGLPEAVEAAGPDATGVLVPPASPRELSGAILRLLNSADERRRMGEAGARRVAELFTIDRMVRRIVGVYRGVAGES